MSFPIDPIQESTYRPLDFLTTDFDFETLEPSEWQMIEAGARMIAGRTLRDLIAWIAEGKNRQSCYLRARYVWWTIDPKQENVKLGALAVSLGVKKQSVGRLQSEFRKRFNFVGPSHKSDAACKAYKKLHKLKTLTNI